MKKQFVWLGSGRGKKENVGNKGSLLDQAAKAALPVPNGGLLLESFLDELLAAEIVLRENGRFCCPNPIELYESLFTAVRFPRFDKPVAVRSAFSAEDGEAESLAGHFDSVLNVDSNNADALTDALCQVWTSALQRDGSFRKDVLILEMVEAQVAGVAFSEAAYQDDLINYTDGLADKLVSGTVSGTTQTMAQIQLGESPNGEQPFTRRLQRLLRGVRHTFGRADWDIEWADDGDVCWLVQIRPVTRPSRRNEAFTFANLREILPDPPSPFMTGVVAQGSDQFFEYYRQFDPKLPTSREMVRVFEGRPFFNITLLTDMMRKWGLPTALVTNSLGGSSDTVTGLRPLRFLRHTLVLLHLGWAQLNAVGSAKQATERILQQAKREYDSFTSLTEAFTDLFVQFVNEMLNLTQALSGPLLILRQTGTLAEHNARQQTIATQLYTDLAPLRDLVQQHPDWHAALKAGELPSDPAFQQLWQAYLDKHGHRGIYESDISRPRYAEAPTPLLTALTAPSQHQISLPPRTVLGQLTRPVWWQCGRVMQAREHWRYDSMRCYALMRQQFLRLAKTAVHKNQLPNIDALWWLSPDEVCQLDSGRTFSKAEIEAKKARFADLKQYDFPDLIHAFDDFEQYREGENIEGGNGRLSGIGLTNGEASGRAWVLQEPSTALPDGFTPENTILIARSVDPGWIATFSQVAGVVVEIGGDLSHGSIILREIGLPAVTNVSQATKRIQTGDAVQVTAVSGKVEIGE